MSRATFVPIVLALVAITLLTAFWSHLLLHGEFEYSPWATARWATTQRPPLPPLTNLLESLYPVVWLLPVGTMAFGLILGRRSEIRGPQVSWYVSCVVFALFVWFMWVFVAFFLMHSLHTWHMH